MKYNHFNNKPKLQTGTLVLSFFCAILLCFLIYLQSCQNKNENPPTPEPTFKEIIHDIQDIA